MSLARTLVTPLALACAVLCLTACDESQAGSSGGISGLFTSVDEESSALDFKSNGTVVARMAGEEGRPGTYSVDGEKVVIDFQGTRTTFIRDGDCIEDAQHVFGKLCKGGKAGAAQNVSTRDLSKMGTGTWVATNADGTFTIDFKAGERFAFSFAPAAGSSMGDQPQAVEGTYHTEGDTLYATLPDGVPLVLKFVNDSFESMSFGLPMKFARK